MLSPSLEPACQVLSGEARQHRPYQPRAIPKHRLTLPHIATDPRALLIHARKDAASARATMPLVLRMADFIAPFKRLRVYAFA